MSAATATVAAPSMAKSGRVRPAAALEQTATMAWRNLVQIKHNPMELIDLSVQPVMFVILFTYVFGGQMAGSPKEYLQYALAGLIVQNALFGTLSTGIGLNTDLTKGVFDRLRSLPIARIAPLLGRVVADTIKQVWSLALMFGLGVLLGFRFHTSVGSVLAGVGLLLLFTLSMAWMAVLIGMVASDPEKVQVFAFTTMMPLTFTSSAFVREDTMPGWLQAWVKVNPVSHLSDAFRGLTTGGEVASPVLWTLVWAAGIAAVFAPLAMRAYRARS
ncbi:ABC transporter permease [Wenjunlia tyrosinilytica]|uniref:Transport permease protein n=1 Tax=Wenjunlia tyrosinilytica TaxID=1544741 RepID=A0A917ZIU9_9ACTN|nr:ABC transporter permease [Wenjunlia tyrosinilytica]GGO83588.1 transport permease protein [Wenjunlia tyrosinilytica]